MQRRTPMCCKDQETTEANAYVGSPFFLQNRSAFAQPKALRTIMHFIFNSKILALRLPYRIQRKLSSSYRYQHPPQKRPHSCSCLLFANCLSPNWPPPPARSRLYASTRVRFLSSVSLLRNFFSFRSFVSRSRRSNSSSKASAEPHLLLENAYSST